MFSLVHTLLNGFVADVASKLQINWQPRRQVRGDVMEKSATSRDVSLKSLSRTTPRSRTLFNPLTL